MSAGVIVGIVFGAIAAFILFAFVLTFTIYWFNLDMKLMHFVYKFLGKHYDKLDKKDKGL